MHTKEFVERWHHLLETKDVSKLDDILSEDAVMISPVVHTPQKGKAITKMYLMAALNVFANDSFRYRREFYAENSVVLEFETKIGETYINGVDMIEFNEEGLITEFRVMVRPLQALNLIHEMMGKMLKSFGK